MQGQVSQDEFQQIMQGLSNRIGGMPGGFRLDPFVFTIDFVTPDQLAASATLAKSFNVQADSAFAICSTTFTFMTTSDVAVQTITSSGTGADAGHPIQFYPSVHGQPFGSGDGIAAIPILCLQTDSGSARALMNNPVPLDSLYGSGQFPSIWSVPKILNPNANFQVQLQNLSATAYHIRLAHKGYKIFGNIVNYLASQGIAAN